MRDWRRRAQLCSCLSHYESWLGGAKPRRRRRRRVGQRGRCCERASRRCERACRRLGSNRIYVRVHGVASAHVATRWRHGVWSVACTALDDGPIGAAGDSRRGATSYHFPAISHRLPPLVAALTTIPIPPATLTQVATPAPTPPSTYGRSDGHYATQQVGTAQPRIWTDAYVASGSAVGGVGGSGGGGSGGSAHGSEGSTHSQSHSQHPHSEGPAELVHAAEIAPSSRRDRAEMVEPPPSSRSAGTSRQRRWR